MKARFSLNTYHFCSLLHIPQQEEAYFTHPRRMNEDFLLAQQESRRKITTIQPLRSLKLNSCFPPIPFLQVSQIPPVLSKGKSLSFVIQTCLWFVIASMSQTSFPLLFPNKLFFSG